MPKEVIHEYDGEDPKIEVRWGGIDRGYVCVGVDRGEPFKFTEDDENDQYTALYVLLDSKESVNRVIKALKKARNKTFK